MSKQSISMECIYEQFLEFKKQLDELGYKYWLGGEMDEVADGYHLILDECGDYWFTGDNHGDVHIPFYNTECFLAVVKTNPSTNEISVGEALYCNEGYTEFGETFKTGEILIVKEVGEYLSQATPGLRESFGLCIPDNTWRKATPQEIIHHFERLDILEKSNNSDGLQKIGYADKDLSQISTKFVTNNVKEYPLTPDESFLQQGYKESDGKLEYELDWEFIEAIAKRMQKAKVKYGKDNWKKPIDPETLKQATLRHLIEVMKGNYSDDGSELGHIEALANNAMMLWHQLKNHKHAS